LAEIAGSKNLHLSQQANIYLSPSLHLPVRSTERDKFSFAFVGSQIHLSLSLLFASLLSAHHLFAMTEQLLVGGKLFSVDTARLAAHSDFFKTLFSSSIPCKRNEYGAIIIEGNPYLFPIVLRYIDGDLTLTFHELESIFDEGDFYIIASLIHMKRMRMELDARRIKVGKFGGRSGLFVNAKSDPPPLPGERVVENTEDLHYDKKQTAPRKGTIIGLSDGNTEVDVEWDDGGKSINLWCCKKGGRALIYL
jgi:hypothetical protein